MARPETRLVRIKAVTEKVGLSRATIYRLMKKGEFPRSISVGAATLWDERKVNQWVNDKLFELDEI